jgi:hypothetical protein
MQIVQKAVVYYFVAATIKIWNAAAAPPLWLSPGVGHPLASPAQPEAKAPPLAAQSKSDPAVKVLCGQYSLL